MTTDSLKAYGLDYRDDENIPSVLCENWQRFTTLAESFNSLNGAQLIFRGQRRADWELSPSLARFNDIIGKSNNHGIVLEEHANDQLELFRKAIRGRVNDHALFDEDDDRQNDELWSIGQHYGLSTPLLDWTYSPFIALFFAFEDSDQTAEPDNPFRIVYVLDKTKVEGLKDIDGEAALTFIEPRKDDHGRLVSQAGLFTRSPYGKTLENALLEALSSLRNNPKSAEDAKIVASYLFRIKVKNEGQAGILRNLRQMNIHIASLKPDLTGASLNCNKLLEESYAPPAHIFALTVESIPATVEIGQPTLSVAPAASVLREWTIQAEPDLLRNLVANGRRGDDYFGLQRELMNELAPHLAQVDWQYHESAVAKMRNVVKVVLRRNNYPEEGRDRIAQDLFTEVIHDRGSA